MGKRKRDEKYYKGKIKKLERKLRKISSRTPSPRRSSSHSDFVHTLTTPERLEHTSTSPLSLMHGQDRTPSSRDAMDCGPSTSTNLDLAPVNAEEEELPLDYLLALGEEGAEKEVVGDPLQCELSLRWAKILQNGIGKAAKDAILQKYPTPSNFHQAIAPKLNPEIKLIMSEISLKRDSRIAYRQNLTGKLLTCLGKSLSKILKGNINTKELIEQINDGAKLASEIFYIDSSSRKFFALAGADKNIRESVKNSKPDEFLFGTDCAEKIKSAQALKKTGEMIKNNASTKKQPATKKRGNWKSPLQQQQFRVRSGPLQQQQQQQHHRLPQTFQPSFRTHQREWKPPAKTRTRRRY